VKGLFFDDNWAIPSPALIPAARVGLSAAIFLLGIASRKKDFRAHPYCRNFGFKRQFKPEKN